MIIPETTKKEVIKIITESKRQIDKNINQKKDKFEKKGMIFSGLSPDNKLPEIIELKNHPWFIGVQFHPELNQDHYHHILYLNHL